jgi:hypothetical protein
MLTAIRATRPPGDAAFHLWSASGAFSATPLSERSPRGTSMEQGKTRPLRKERQSNQGGPQYGRQPTGITVSGEKPQRRGRPGVIPPEQRSRKKGQVAGSLWGKGLHPEKEDRAPQRRTPGQRREIANTASASKRRVCIAFANTRIRRSLSKKSGGATAPTLKNPLRLPQ